MAVEIVATRSSPLPLFPYYRVSKVLTAVSFRSRFADALLAARMSPCLPTSHPERPCRRLLTSSQRARPRCLPRRS